MTFVAATRAACAAMIAVVAIGATAARAGDRGAAPRPAASSPQARRDVELVVFKSARRLALYRDGNFVREYDVVLGLEPVGRKRHEGDARTPEGLYRVTGKRRHARWQWFLDLDYPNGRDRSAYAAELAAGRIPDDGAAPLAIGGSIGIHGNDRPVVQEAGIDWTKGCIALRAADIDELAREVTVGAPVWIVE